MAARDTSLVCCCLMLLACGWSQSVAGTAAAAAAAPRPGPRNGTLAHRLQDCASLPISVQQRELAQGAAVVITGITLAAGPGAGRCDDKTGALNIALDNSTEPAVNFIVLGVQCVHKGLLSCRSNEEDTKDCLILVAAPSIQDAVPCSIAQGERYQFYLQEQTNGCPGYYITAYKQIFHSVRRPLGGTGCSFYPSYPAPDDLQTRLAATCVTPVECRQDLCDPTISRSPCANDTAVACSMKRCPNKWMYFNAIMPEDTCYEVYSYASSGIPTNCYGRRYINNRIRQLAAQGALANMTDPGALNRTQNGSVAATSVLQSEGADGASSNTVVPPAPALQQHAETGLAAGDDLDNVTSTAAPQAELNALQALITNMSPTSLTSPLPAADLAPDQPGEDGP